MPDPQTATPDTPESPSLPSTLIEGIARLLLRSDRLPDWPHIANSVLHTCLAMPGFGNLSTSAQSALINTILDCGRNLADNHRGSSSVSCERAMSHAGHLVPAQDSPVSESDAWSSSDGETFHISSITYPNGRRFFFPQPHSSIPLRRLEVVVLDDVVDDCIDEEYVDDEERDDDDVPDLVEL
ncbi:hypothetical protein C8T65DRAFT_747432 [Cerioporus squamosus]|nr:hypothetical protein C8T65DRAFT_747432 [Cerioporus squamosus]